MSILFALILCIAIGTSVGAIAAIVSGANWVSALGLAVAGIVGAVFAGFIMPQLGFAVSSSLLRGLLSTFAGAAFAAGLLRFFIR